MAATTNAVSMKLTHQGQDAAWLQAAPLLSNPADQLTRLGPQDRERADSFCRNQRLAEFVTARLLLAEVVEGELGVAPSAWEVESADGPPRISSWSNRQPPSVSLSHAGGWSAAAVSQRGKIGVDLEVAGREARGVPEYLGWPIQPSGEEFTLAWTLWEATAKAVHGGVFRRRNEGFRALARAFVDAEGSLTVINGWLAVSHKLTEKVRVTIALDVDTSTGWEATSCEV